MRIGILGNGQLAQMLSEAASSLGLSTDLLSNEHLSNEERLSTFLAKITHLTFENEFIDVELIKSCLKKIANPIQTSPSLHSISVLQNKIHQKKLLEKLKIPTAQARFNPINFKQNDFQNSVLKWATFGYDGKGTLIAPHEIEEVDRFVQMAKEKGTEIFVEEKLNFKKELAILGVRSSQGAFKNYPLVISVQKKGICDTVYGPAIQFGIDERFETQATENIKAIMNELNYIGAMAVEFFLTDDNRLLVNEIAPRVHNSAHYTLSSKAKSTQKLTSQFENHIRALADLPLGETETAALFAMKNIVGLSPADTRFVNEPGFRDYKKGEVKPGRKMGHVNFVGEGSSFKKFIETLVAE